jgi:hypothetical protein
MSLDGRAESSFGQLDSLETTNVWQPVGGTRNFKREWDKVTFCSSDEARERE